jgi:hypothetical protein
MLQKIKRWFQRPQNPAGHVYYARLVFPQGTYYEVGFTTKPTLVERMAFGGPGEEKLIDREFLFAYRKDAWDVEQTLLDHFGKHRAFKKFSNDPMMPLNGRGQTELFRHDILGLDDDLYRLSDQDRVALDKDVAQAGGGCLMVLLGLALVPFTLGLSLLFIAGGTSDVFTYGKGRHPPGNRPQHPVKIQQLLDALSDAMTANKDAAEGKR